MAIGPPILLVSTCMIMGVASVNFEGDGSSSSSSSSSSKECTGWGDDSVHDWLVAGCTLPSTVSSSTKADGSTVYALSNGIVTRELTVNASTQVLSTTAIRMTANATSPNLVQTIVPEASLAINNIPIQVGGVRGQIGDARARVALFSAVRPSLPVVAGGYPWIPGIRGSNPHAAWPPKGSRVEFDHTLPCMAVDKNSTNANEWITITIPYELYDGTSGFTRRVVVTHNCSGPPLLITDVIPAYMALVNDGHVEYQCDSEAAVAKAVHLADGTRTVAQSPYSHGEGMVGLAAGESYRNFLSAEIFHAATEWNPHALGGVDRYARESARFSRVVTPQIEQMVVYVQGICVGGNKVFPADGEDGTVGYWCYDDEGTAGIKQLIDQAKEMETDMIVFGQNLNQSWRSMIGPEFQTDANTTWFAELVARAHNTAGGEHSVEVGVYQLLLNARSASALNQVAPDNAFELANHYYDAMDPSTSLPDHNSGKESCKGGPSCASLCAATSFFQTMKATMLSFWQRTKLSAVDQDGSRYMPCSNASHAHHHGYNDSMRVQFEEVKALFHTYLDIPSSFPTDSGVPRVAFVTSASSNFLEAGQAKVPGGYNEQVWSLPRWHWIDLQRVLIIKGIDTYVNTQRYYPIPLSMPYHNVQYNPDDPIHWKSCYGYLTNATLAPLEEHLQELNWVLSQTFGTGIMAQLRSRYLYDGPRSKAILQRWIAWFRRYSGILSQDFVTLSLTTSCVNETQPTMKCTLDPSTGIDAIIHHGSPGIRSDFVERAMVMVWNPAEVWFNGTLSAPLYYSGLTHAAGVKTVGISYEGATPAEATLRRDDSVELAINLAPRALTWIVVLPAN